MMMMMMTMAVDTMVVTGAHGTIGGITMDGITIGMIIVDIAEVADVMITMKIIAVV